jgi:predicted amidophosphoribosyltransferase
MESRGVPVRRILLRRGGTAQKSLNRGERLKGGALRYGMRGNIRTVSGDVVLLDDVTTTGATLNVCAGTLRRFGAERVFALVVCRD